VFGDVGYGGVFVYLGGDASGFLQLSGVLIDNTNVEDVAVGDVNGDGVADIVTANEANSPSHCGVSVLLGEDDGGFGAPQNYLAGHLFMVSVVLGDFTGDDNIDIAFNSGQDLGLLRGNGDGTFAAPELFPVAGVSALAAGKFNGDGWLDIVSGNPFDPVFVQLNDGVWQAEPKLIGDYNLDQSVDAADYVMWRKLQGTPVTPWSGPDGNGDGVVEQDDYGEWRERFAQSASPPPAGSGISAVAELNSPSLQVNDAKEAVEARGAREEQWAILARETAFIELLACRPIGRAEFCPAVPLSLGSRATTHATRRDDALLLGLSQSDLKHESDEWNGGHVFDGKDANYSGDSLLHLIDGVFALLTSD
jgi:hypothetical protein